jgi:hypothetical protein
MMKSHTAKHVILREQLNPWQVVEFGVQGMEMRSFRTDAPKTVAESGGGG